jgi:3-methyladenine DNA glycosylase AlkD
MTASDVTAALMLMADERQAAVLTRFFKTGPGDYGEGDRFIGVRVPQTRLVVRESRGLPLAEIEKLVADPIHEVRLCGLLILVDTYERSKSEAERERLVDFYLSHTSAINNWDLVDVTAPRLLGHWLLGRDRSVLYRLAASSNLWEQRIALVATLRLIRANDFVDALALCELLMSRPHDLIRKALGWMLREVGKRDRDALTAFLDAHWSSLSRTSLRYAIEQLPEPMRLDYLRRR